MVLPKFRPQPRQPFLLYHFPLIMSAAELWPQPNNDRQCCCHIRVLKQARLSTWATAWQNQQNDMCAQRRFRSAWASAQSDQSLRCPHEEALRPWLPIERTAKTLVRLGEQAILLVLSCCGSVVDTQPFMPSGLCCYPYYLDESVCHIWSVSFILFIDVVLGKNLFSVKQTV